MEVRILDVPVYRISSEDYYAYLESARDKQRADIESLGPAGYTISEPIKRRISDRQLATFGPWDFNEVLGYIRLHFLGRQVRGEYFSAEKKRNPISRKKVFTWRTHKLAPERSFNPKASNDEIFQTLRQYIADCRVELPKRFIDDSALEKLGPFVDWRSFRHVQSKRWQDEEDEDR